MAEVDLQALCDQAPLHQDLGITVSRTERGVTCRATVGDRFVVDAARGTVHGGIIATLLDTAVTFALIAGSGHDWVTVDLRVDYLRPVLAGTGTTEAEVLRAGRRIGSARATLCDARGNQCAVAIGTFAAAGGTAGASGDPTRS
jgi:uncharacterized protein (TIGR00369 family)